MDLGLTCGGRVSTLLTGLDELTDPCSRELLLPRNKQHFVAHSSRCLSATLALGFDLRRRLLLPRSAGNWPGAKICEAQSLS